MSHFGKAAVNGVQISQTNFDIDVKVQRIHIFRPKTGYFQIQRQLF